MREKVFEAVKKKLNNSEISDEQIYDTVDRIAEHIKEFCNRTDIPQGLFYTWIDMAVDYEKSIISNSAEIGESDEDETSTIAETSEGGDIKSFSVDGVSMTFVTSLELEEHKLKMKKLAKAAGEESIENLLSDYANILYKYRKLRR